VARIKDDSVEAVKAAIDMVDLVSAYTTLRKAGSQYTARCPFHEERTPSFSVNAVDKLYYCFGCGAKGDAIGFVREKEGLAFAEAVEWLADRFRVPLEYEETSPAQEARRRRVDRLYALLEQTAGFYERYLWDSSAGDAARRYLEGRGLAEAVCREFRLGLSPVSGRAVGPKARERGFAEEELLATGLVNRRGNDYFRGRLMFPLADARGRAVGFQARRLRDDDPLPAKYVNSPEGELFRKGSLLYGLDRARAAIAREDRAIVVEGNPDVLALRQTGLQPVVAAMGTALTEQQLRELARLTTRIWLCFDGDDAGEAATLRGMELAVARGFDVRVVPLPPGVDPADAAAGFDRLLGGAKEYLVHRVEAELKREPDRKQAAERIARFLPDTDSVERQDAVRVAADVLRVPPELFAPKAIARAGVVVPAKALEAGDSRERAVLAGVVRHRSLVSLLESLTRPEHFDSELHRQIRETLVSGEDEAELVGVLAELDARAAAEEIDERTAKEALFRLCERGLRRELARSSDPTHRRELQDAIVKVGEEVAALA
jgi:DNA primase